MKLSFLTEDVEHIDRARALGYDGVELAAGAVFAPLEGAAPAASVEDVRARVRGSGAEITTIAYYDMAFDPPPASEVPAVYERVFDLAEALEVEVVASMSGFDAERDWDENIELFTQRFAPVAASAERRGLRVAFENWMGYEGRLPFKPENLGGSPDTWRQMFAAVPSPALGIEFDPSHLYAQGIDHLRALREFADRVHHVHAKDTELLPEVRYERGANGNTFRFRIPGYGGIEWAPFIATLVEVGYDGAVAVEHEDPVFSGERFEEGLIRARHTLAGLIDPAAGIE